ncbi:unnamed protein product [Meganyctiphanes norvegica]|uniref:MADF domain-containing protein n=1 Tax=Meganyctiphanes norvegica TaxID=48144 RepID=A0AAV2SAY0_MEGNR
MDVESLIVCVFQKPAVWDKKHKMHSNKNVVEGCWKEISREMNCDEFELRKKWKYLRDQFSVEFGKFPLSLSSDASEHQKSKWKYFHLLTFLKTIVKPRISDKVISDVRTSDTASPGSFNNEEDNTDDFEPPLESQEGTSKFPKTEEYNKKFQYILSRSNRKRDREDDEYRSRNREDTDEDLMFFKSLLTHVRKIPDNKKLKFRNRIQDLVEQFAYSSPDITNSYHTPRYAYPSPTPNTTNTCQTQRYSYSNPSSPVDPAHFVLVKPEEPDNDFD